jgi:hypothetical protein
MIRATFRSSQTRILDFDIETRAAGYADPAWVPDDVTCYAWSWVGSDAVQGEVSGPDACFGPYEKQREWLRPLRALLCAADIVTGHNILRFDLRVLNANFMRFGLDPLPPLLVQDTMRLPRSKGLKKGQDNLGDLLEIPIHKLPLNHQQWDEAYRVPGWPTVKERCMTDVEQHKLMRAAMLHRGWLSDPVRWRG